mmetsp:Transcript_18598/g.34455  ORF Transcript_18598/g.34455 Transcript_18598/m.34455 type:complete len:264 (-) Transcript_18598:1080-1871(-)
MVLSSPTSRSVLCIVEYDRLSSSSSSSSSTLPPLALLFLRLLPTLPREVSPSVSPPFDPSSVQSVSKSLSLVSLIVAMIRSSCCASPINIARPMSAISILSCIAFWAWYASPAGMSESAAPIPLPTPPPPPSFLLLLLLGLLCMPFPSLLARVPPPPLVTVVSSNESECIDVKSTPISLPIPPIPAAKIALPTCRRTFSSRRIRFSYFFCCAFRKVFCSLLSLENFWCFLVWRFCCRFRSILETVDPWEESSVLLLLLLESLS